MQAPVLGHAAGRGRWSARCWASSSGCLRCACAVFTWRSAHWRCIFSSSIWAASTKRAAAFRPASSSIRRAIAGKAITDARAWYFILLAAAAATLLLCANLLRARPGRAWAAIRANETVAEALGIGVASYKLLAFVDRSALTAVAGALFAYYRGFVSVEAFSLFLSIQYVAMIIIGGMGSLLGAILGATLRHAVSLCHRGGLGALPAPGLRRLLFAVNSAAFGARHDPLPGAGTAWGSSACGDACKPTSWLSGPAVKERQIPSRAPARSSGPLSARWPSTSSRSSTSAPSPR